RARLWAPIRAGDGAAWATLAKEHALQQLSPTSLVIIARELAAVKEWAAADQILRAGLYRKPGDFWLNHTLGMLLKNQQPPRPEEALHYLTVALALRSDSPGVHLNMGNLLMDMGNLEGAIRHYGTACPTDPNSGTAPLHLADALGAKRDWDGAIAAYRKVIVLDPTAFGAHVGLADALRSRGIALARKGPPDEAITEYKEAIRLNPKYAEA